MNSKSWFFHPVLRILNARNAKARRQKNSFLHLAQELLFPILSLPLHHPEAAVVQAFHEVNNFFRSED